MRSAARAPIVLAVALGTTLALGAPALGGSFDPAKVIRTAPQGTTLRAGGMAADGPLLGVAWDEKGTGAARSYLRVSEDGGGTFDPIIPLRGGRPASDPRVAMCGVVFVFAVSTWPRSGGGSRVGLDLHPYGELFWPGHRALGPGSRPDVACDGSTMAAAWFDEDKRVRYHVQYFTDADGCPSGCRFVVTGKLGKGTPREGLSIGTWRRGFIVAWKDGPRLLVRRLVLDFDDRVGLVVKPQAPLTLLDSSSARFPRIAGDRGRVALAYHWRGGVRVRMSGDAGRSFGPARVLRPACTDCGVVARPLSVDVAGSRVLVEALTGIGSPPVPGTMGFLSTDGGAAWTSISRHREAAKVGALDGSRVAEAWDKRYVNGRTLRFHAGPQP
jgi:hypothetical protein